MALRMCDTYRVVCDLPTPVRTAVMAMTGLVDGNIVFCAEQMPNAAPQPMTWLPLSMTY